MKAEKLSLMNKVLILSRTLGLLGVSFVILICSSLAAKADESVFQQQQYSIAQGPLGKVLSTFALSANIDFAIDDSLTTGKSSSGLEGVYSVQKGLQEILLNTGITFEQISLTSFVLKARPETQDASAIIIHGLRDTDEDGYNDVYDKNTSTAYMGKEEVERYKGATPSDLLQGIAGVFSGEARNSGALDVNIRGVQGPGRVPVTIDGTEQALTVWRGYNGASNRNYIDPNLISNIQIYKGITNERDVRSGIGGAMVVKTLVPDDVIAEGEDFGIEYKVESSSNAVKERVPRLHTGELASNVIGFPETNQLSPYLDKTLRLDSLNSKSANDSNPLSGNDYAYRIAMAKKTEQFDVLAAYAYRERGNYYSGKNNADYYSDSLEDSHGTKDYIRSLALYWKPGDEVTNTSSMMKSLLLKTNWKIDEAQSLSFNYRQSNSVYGEIMPSRIDNVSERGAIQWPLSEVTAKAYNLDYKYKPDDKSWIDLHANLWRTDTLSDTYSSGGFPNQLRYDFGNNNALIDDVLVNGGVTNAKNIRNGLSLSNLTAITPSLDLTVAGDFQHERLSSSDSYAYTKTLAGRAYPRAGRREEWSGSFDLAWKQSDKLTLSAGLTYGSYWAFDDFLAAHPNQFENSVLKGYNNFEYKTFDPYTPAERQQKIDTDTDMIGMLETINNPIFQSIFVPGLNPPITIAAFTQKIYDDRVANWVYGDSNTVPIPGEWLVDSEGNLDRAENPCLNGSYSHIENLIGCTSSPIPEIVKINAEKQKDHGWVPHFNLSYELTDNSRAYVNYNEALRFPSMFESTIAFSASLSPYGIKPEHSRNWEIGYVHDLTSWLTEADYADLKFTFYNNVTKDVIERNSKFFFDNVEKQTIRGLEADFRYDSGKFFSNFGVNYVLKNEICDENSAARISATAMGRALISPIPKCFEYGFPSGYQLTQATPKLSANISLGRRFLNRRLEVGSRVTYYQGYDNQDLDEFANNSYKVNSSSDPYNPTPNGYSYAFNTPYSWDDTLIFDAYARYKVNKSIDLEFTANNITDIYYADPATRSAMAAPGRTFKLSLTGRF